MLPKAMKELCFWLVLLIVLIVMIIIIMHSNEFQKELRLLDKSFQSAFISKENDNYSCTFIK